MNTPFRHDVTNVRLVWLVVFGIAMGLLEAIVVVYLRELYFPGGFRFPLQPIPEQILRTEILRELSTIVMLVAIAAIATRTFLLRFAVFLFTFGVWDLFYYVFLKVLLDWPQSFFTWDVLFLVPLTWLAPVLAPVICALTMIALAILLIFLHRRYNAIRTGWLSWLILVTGAAAVFSAFIRDSAGIVIRGGFVSDLAGLAGNTAYQAAIAAFEPVRFSWWLFIAGESLILVSGAMVYGRTVHVLERTHSREPLQDTKTSHKEE